MPTYELVEPFRSELEAEKSRSRPVVTHTGPLRHELARMLKTQTLQFDSQELTVPGVGGLDVRVSKKLLPRAARVCDALLHAWQERAWSVRIGDRRGEPYCTIPGRIQQDTLVDVCGELVPVVLRELMVKTEKTDKIYWGYREPSGQLRLQLGADQGSASVSDGEKGTVEAQLGSLFLRMIRRANLLRIKREERDRLYNEYKRQARAAQVLAAAIKRKKLRDEATLEAALQWLRSEDLRRYAERLERAAADEISSSRRRRLALRQAALVREHAEACDPLRRFLWAPSRQH